MQKLKDILSKNLVLVKENCDQWQNICNNCEIELTAIVNSAQQISSCQKAKLENTSLQEKFPDIKNALVCKLLLHSQKAFDRLSEKVKMLQKCLSQTQEVAKKSCDIIQPHLLEENIYVWTATQPAITDIALWINSFAAIMKQNYAEKVTLLEQLGGIFVKLDKNSNVKKVNEISKLWMNNQNLIDAKDEIMKYCFTLLPSK